MTVAAPRHPEAPPLPPAAPAGASDAALAAAARRGDQASFEQLAMRHADLVFGFLLRRLGNRHDAEEIAQEAMLRAWVSIDRYDPRWRFSTWLCTIAHRQAISTHRRRRIAIEPHPVNTAAAETAAPAPDGAPAGAGVWAVAARILTDVEYEALWLRYAADRSPREVAVILQRTPVAARVMLHRARERLRRALAEVEGVEGVDR